MTFYTPMKKTLMIADLHLREDRPDITALFFDFLQTSASQAQVLYILGDLFEYWIGDDDPSPFIAQVAFELKKLANLGIKIYFIHGNRDFLLGKKFAKKSGMILLPEHYCIELYGQQVLIMHGDTLCTLDVEYQNFRQKSRKKWWQWMILSLPLFVRRKIANDARQRSEMNGKSKSVEITDVTQLDVEKQMLNHQVSLLIHGHTHRPATHEFTLNGTNAKRIVLGDWYTQGSVLEITPDQMILKNRPFMTINDK